MSQTRLRGTIHPALVRRLPRNLVVFDGHCLWCQERVRYTLERNFSFFAFGTLLTQGWDNRTSRAQLSKHQMHFASFDSATGEELLRVVFKRNYREIRRPPASSKAHTMGTRPAGSAEHEAAMQPRSALWASLGQSSNPPDTIRNSSNNNNNNNNTNSSTTRSHHATVGPSHSAQRPAPCWHQTTSDTIASDRAGIALLPLPDDLVFLFFEKVPSESAAALRTRRAQRPRPWHTRLSCHTSTHSTAASDAFAADTPARARDTPGAPFSHWCGRDACHGDEAHNAATAHELAHPPETDILVSTNYVALCRMGMHLDRWLLRWFWWACYRLLPHWCGNAVFDRRLSRRRRAGMWGTSEEDAVAVPQRILGMAERRWSTRCRGRPRQAP